MLGARPSFVSYAFGNVVMVCHSRLAVVSTKF